MADEQGGVRSIYSEPTIRFLHQVLDDLHRGEIVLPRFQRPFVWPVGRRIALLESIIEGIPIGAIMEWRSRSRDFAVKETLGPFRLPKEDQSQPLRRYLLDGEQRMMTLYLALYDPSLSDGARDEEDPRGFEAFYDLEAERFVTRAQLADEEEEPGSLHLPLRSVLNTRQFNLFLRGLSKLDLETSVADRYEFKAERIMEAFRAYKLPVMPIVTEDLRQAERTFERINSQHVTMSEAHMLNALTWTRDFDLLERFEAIKEERLAALGWGSIDEEDFIRACKVVLGLREFYDSDTRDMSEKIRQRPETLDDAGSLMADVARFFSEVCGIEHPDLVPYTSQIVLVAHALRAHPALSDRGRELLRDWLWYTTYNEIAGRQMRGTLLTSLRRDVERLARGERLGRPRRFPPRKPLPRFDMRGARTRRLTVMLAERQASLSPSNAREPFRRLALLRSATIPHLVPWQGSSWTGSAGARVLASEEQVNRLRQSLASGNPTAEDLEAFVIPPGAVRDYRSKEYAEFVRKREDRLNKIEEEHFKRVQESIFEA